MNTFASRAVAGIGASVIALARQSEFAQSSVTRYGVADVSVQSETSASDHQPIVLDIT